MKNLTKTLDLMALLVNSNKTFKELTPILLKFFLKIKKGGRHFLTHSIRQTLQKKKTTRKYTLRTMMPKPRKKKYQQIKSSSILKGLYTIIYHDQVGFISGMLGWFHIQNIVIFCHINRMKGKGHMIISFDVEKAFDKIHTLS